MTEALSDATLAATTDHADKYNDPRVRITKRGLWLLAAVFVFSIVGTGLSLWLRRTRLEQTRAFLGPTAIIALQLSERVHFVPSPALSRDNPSSNATEEPIDVSRTPGLGYFRRALLDERHYLWSSRTSGDVASLCQTGGKCVQVRLTDPTQQRFDEVSIDIELTGGWVGLAGGNERVQVTERVRPAIQNFVERLIQVKLFRMQEVRSKSETSSTSSLPLRSLQQLL